MKLESNWLESVEGIGKRKILKQFADFSQLAWLTMTEILSKISLVVSNVCVKFVGNCLKNQGVLGQKLVF